MRELNIDWAALHSAFQMNMPEVKCFLSIDDGRVLKLPPGDPALGTVRADPQRYFPIEAVPSRIQYQWLDDFIKSVDDEAVKARMEAAINGKGAFRRFKDILLTLPDERRRWFEFRDQMMRQRIIDWIREQGIVALNEPTWLSQEQLDNLPKSLDSSSLLPSSPVMPAILQAMPSSSSSSNSKIPNNPMDIDALRDYLIEWVDKRHAHTAPTPLELEDLAHQVAARFRVIAL